MSEIKLLPCPFCGGEAKACKYYFIQCTKCGTSTLTHTNREEAIESWNTRKPMQEIMERLEKEKGIAFLTLANTGNKMKDIVYDEVMVYLNTAIEIVKEVGGMNGTIDRVDR